MAKRPGFDSVLCISLLRLTSGGCIVSCLSVGQTLVMLRDETMTLVLPSPWCRQLIALLKSSLQGAALMRMFRVCNRLRSRLGTFLC